MGYYRDAFNKTGCVMKDEDWVIGRAVFDILLSDSEQQITKELLIERLTQKYLDIYENSALVEDVLLYESALRIVKDSYS